MASSTKTVVTGWEEVDLTFRTATITVVVTTDGRALTGLRFGTAADNATTWLGRSGATRSAADLLEEAVAQLQAYATGRRTEFDLPLDLAGTPFQVAVWSALREVPYGRTVTYGWLARQVGRPGSARAVGAAVGSNPIGIVVPCHRVIGANGSLTGFAGGLDNKMTLLAGEGAPAL